MLRSEGLTRARPREQCVSREIKELFTADEVPGLRMPDGYKASVAAWHRQHDGR
ncbi:hypothetical protein [Streptomyces sp. Rer75]|uniref:hypothetical protein n=1 Tax=Streptomyces sp. Rer75 TaxID=2750011 RepID=UPI0015D0A0F2|nr:hypothetical protein [Streptomyces sp. Rer75]QLH22373.1 hypothetical protein HYQ63_18605 [Streptomyces sp. Rer75]